MGGSRRRNKRTQPRHQTDEGARGAPVESTHQRECAGPSQPSTRQDEGTPVITYRRKACTTGPSAAHQKDYGASQEAGAENVKNRKGNASTRTTKAEKRPLKRKQMVDEGDSGEDAEEVAPRAPSEQTQPSADTRYDAIDTTRCFFLEFDEDGFAKKNREHIQVDITKILPIPEGDILFNHRTLDETFVQSIYDAIHYAAKETNGKWDIMTFILAPIVPNGDGSQGRRITPKEFDVALALTYHWYAVAGQHTAEAMNRLIKYKSPAEKVYGLRSYSHVRVVYFDDDNKRGYPYVSTFDNTREECSIPRYKNGLTDDKWTEERDHIPDDKARKVPRRLGGPDEIHGGNGAGLEATQAMYKETSFHLKCFIYEAIDCLDNLREEVNRISSNARHIFWEVGKRITTILPYEIELKGVVTDNKEVVGTARGMKIRAIILDMSTSQKCVPWDDDAFSELHAFLTTCCGENWALIIFAPMKHQKQVMQSVYKWDDVEVLTGSWYRHYTPSTTVNKYDNIAVRYIDMMAIVLHVENDNLNNITVAPKLRAELTNFNIEEGEFVRCSGKCIGVEGDTDAVYSWMERESACLRKLCSSFIREDDGVMLLGRAHAGLIWELARAGHHVFACDDTTKELTYLFKFLDFYVKDPRNRCRFEKPQVEHRKDRDIYYKLGRKREKVWAYLFGDAPQSVVDNEYVIRKSELEIAMNEYHGSHMGSFHMFVARCRDYADLARKVGNFNNIDCDEDTSDSDLDVPSRAARGAAEGALGEEPQGSTNGPAEKASLSMGATRASEGNVETRMTGRGERNGVPTNPVGVSEGIVNSQGNTGGGENGCAMAPPTAGPSSTHAPQAEQRTLTSMDTDEDEELDMTALTPKLVPGRPLPQGFAPDPSVPYLLQDKYKESSKEDWGHHILWHEENAGASEEAIAAKAKALFEHLRANKKLKFSTKFYDLASSVSYGSINWKIGLASAVQGIDSINSLKIQDVIASNTIIAIARGDPACETDTRANAGHVQDEQQRACAQQSTPRSAMRDSTMIRKDGDDMESGALTEQRTGGVNDGTTNVGSFRSLVATMTARQGISEMMETDAGQDDESQAVKVPQEEVAATTEQSTKGEGSREHISIIDMTSESTGEDMIQEKEQNDDNNAPRVEGDHEKDVQQLRRSTRIVIKKVVVDA
ncbi:hypothetical protein CBR_g8718 [Chara braunii]|uniref:Uncharacterized protein n=1 Tax=Chara braunii TaxID=69332 RepID=A0A388KMN1_CHABU|nr:hypothetical protein CBR_g8718 [Chara braunii]|eukprot:GBG71297.1 hypothetical protein CBR_g8718 [Chara braunii]